MSAHLQPQTDVHVVDYVEGLNYRGDVWIYKGHDAPRTAGGPDPKTLDLAYRTYALA